MQSRALHCEVCNVSSAGATSEWFYKNEASPEIKLMMVPNKYSISNDQLMIMNTNENDRGRYRCVLTPLGGDPVNGSFAFQYTVLSELRSIHRPSQFQCILSLFFITLHFFSSFFL